MHSFFLKSNTSEKDLYGVIIWEDIYIKIDVLESSQFFLYF